jgi:hypothetical protein
VTRRRNPTDIFDLLGCGVGFALTIPLWMVVQSKLPHSDGPGPLLFYGCAALPGILVAFRVATLLRERIPKGMAILFVVGFCFLAAAAKAVLQPHGPSHTMPGHPPGHSPPDQPGPRPDPAPPATETAPAVSRTQVELDPRSRAIDEATRAADGR